MERIIHKLAENLHTIIGYNTGDEDAAMIMKLSKKANSGCLSDEDDAVIEQFRSVNKTNTYTIDVYPLFISVRGKTAQIYELGTSDSEKTISNSQIYNMNVNSGYRVTIDNRGFLICNIFLRKDFLSKKPDSLDASETGLFILNLRYVILNMLKFGYPELKEQYINIGAAVGAVAVANLIGLSFTPSMVAKYLEVSPQMAEAIFEKYDYEKHKFNGIPWLF